jgi:glutamate racemase
MNDISRRRTARVLVFDSGLGGLTVFREIANMRPDVALTYAADDAAFPYGAMSEAALVARVLEVVRKLVARVAPDVAVIACNTASTLVLAPLRAAIPDIPFVGTVPAIKPAAVASRSRLVSLLATPGTVARDYTAALLRDHAGDCQFTLVGSARLAGMAEALMRGNAVADADIACEIAPCFVEAGGRRTDTIVLACTHYPLLRDKLASLSPWPVNFIDSAPAIARRVDSLLGARDDARHPRLPKAIFTSRGRPDAALRAVLSSFGIQHADGEA